MTDLHVFITFCVLVSLGCAAYLMKAYKIPYSDYEDMDTTDPLEAPELPQEPRLPLNIQIYQEALKWVGKDPSPRDIADDDRGCSESVSNIINLVIPDFPAGVLSTADLKKILDKDTRFHQELSLSPGCIVISPRTASTFGHVGIALDGVKIASTNSFGQNKGLFTINYSQDSWKQEFNVKRALHTYYYKGV